MVRLQQLQLQLRQSLLLAAAVAANLLQLQLHAFMRYFHQKPTAATAAAQRKQAKEMRSEEPFTGPREERQRAREREGERERKGGREEGTEREFESCDSSYFCRFLSATLNSGGTATASAAALHA